MNAVDLANPVKPKTAASTEAGWTTKGAAMRGYVAVFEATMTRATPPTTRPPGVIAAADTREETERLMLEAMAEHLALLRELGQPVPSPPTRPASRSSTSPPA